MTYLTIRYILLCSFDIIVLCRSTISHLIPCHNLAYEKIHQLGSRYERQLMSDGGAWSPFCSILLVLTHDFTITCVYGPMGIDGHEWMVPTRTLVAHHFWPFEAKGVLYAWGPVQPANGCSTRTTSG